MSNGTFGYLERIVSISIKKSGPPFFPWYTFAPVQQPTALSLVGVSPPTSTGNFQVRPNFSEISGGPFGPPTTPLIPKIGHSSLEAAIDSGTPLDDYNQINFMAKPQQNTSGDTPFHTPTIWQITGLKQPLDKHGAIMKPSGSLAAQVANTAKTMWNSTSSAYNAEWTAHNGSKDGFQINYPTSSFKVPIGNPSDPTTRFAFTGGVPAGFWLFQGRSILLAAVWASNIEVGQLDPAVWDTDSFPPFRR